MSLPPERPLYRFAPALIALGVFLAFSAIYLTGHHVALFGAMLKYYPITPADPDVS